MSVLVTAALFIYAYYMTVSTLANLLQATIHTGENLLNLEIKCACGADLMSDVMAFVKEEVVLLTGLTNLQAIRTAEIMDIRVIVFVRGKKPDREMIELAKEKNMALLSTDSSLFISCGKLYKAGLTGAGVRPIQDFH